MLPFSLTNTIQALAWCTLLLILGLTFSQCQSAADESREEDEALAGDMADTYLEGVKAEGVEMVEQKDAYGNTERYARRVSDYAKEGPYTLLSPEGKLMERAQYRNDLLHGTRIIYFENGDTQVVERYLEGKFQGPYRAYYEGGALELSGEYTNNVMEGEWKRYYPSGQLMEVVMFQDNQENGPFTEYYENGSLKAEGYYKEGDNEHGLLKLYDEQGEHIKSMNCQHGVCRTVWEKGQSD